MTWNLFPAAEHNFPKKMNSLFCCFGEPQIFASISITQRIPRVARSPGDSVVNVLWSFPKGFSRTRDFPWKLHGRATKCFQMQSHSVIEETKTTAPPHSITGS